ncbi:MAG: hypothetical protein ACE5IP_07880 [Terriglobia bacterium]
MYLELGVAAVLAVVGMIVFGRFEEKTARWRRALKWAIYFGLTILLSRLAGRWWALAWVIGLPALGLTFHAWWCRKHGIGILSAEPREKYYALRGWK